MYVCMYVEGILALLGSPPTCHKATGVNCHKSGHYTPHDQHMIKKNSPKLVGFNMGFQPYTGHE